MKLFEKFGLLFLGLAIIFLAVLSVHANTINTAKSGNEQMETNERMFVYADPKTVTTREKNSDGSDKSPKEYEDNSISVKGLLHYFETIKKDFAKLSKIEITEKFLEGRKLYFAEIQKDFFWESELYLIKTQDDVITDAVIIGASGLNRLFEYDVIDISQGEFIAAYCSSHMGSGNLELISIDNLGKSMYSIPAIDNYFEDTEETSITHGLSKEYGDGIYASKIFLNGKLSAVYEDVNDDGNTDIILKGVQQVYKNEGDVQILDSETFIKMVYLFDTHSNQFVLE